MDNKKTQGVAIGGGDSDEENGNFPKKTNTVEIYANLDEEEQAQKDEGTSYDPPANQERENPSNDLLAMMEKEINNRQNTKEETKTKKAKHDKKKERPKKVDDWDTGRSKQELIVKENQDFERYYQKLGILSQAEWETFFNKLKEPLDICFRINSVDKNAEKTKAEINKKIAELSQVQELKSKVPHLVKWYPSQMTFAFDDLSRTELRQNPLLKSFHQFLVQETENGRIFRQEAVSMIPVTLLDVKPDHYCVDMCAAPGSKTIQILEYLHAKKEQTPKGFVIANDTDSKRAYMLTHQARRLNSPSMFVSNNDARFFPILKVDKHDNHLRYDRILCDVPCSGDGTLRKNNSLWKNWNAHLGHACHPLQLDILEKAISMLKKGGRLVYSTCSFNPIENEAVVAAALSRHIKQVELVDISKEVSPHLKYRPGLTSWQVLHKGKGKRNPPEWYQTFDQVKLEWKKKYIKETMFSDTYTMFNNEVDRTDDQKYDPLNLKRCMRIYPHDQNYGGFFVAVITKTLDDKEGIILDDMYKMNAWDNPLVRQKPILEDLSEFVNEYEQALKDHEAKNNVPKELSTQNEFKQIITEAQQEEKKVKDASGLDYGSYSQQRDAQKDKDFPYIKLKENKPDIWANLVNYYGISSDFPSEYLFYQKDTTKKIVLVGEGIDKLFSCKRVHKLHVVNCGVKMFYKNKGDKSIAKYRLLQEGLEVLFPYLSDKRKIPVSKEFFVKMLEVHSMTFDEVRTEWKEEEVTKREQGSAIMCHKELYGTIWIGVNNVSLMLSKEEVRSFKFLIK